MFRWWVVALLFVGAAAAAALAGAFASAVPALKNASPRTAVLGTFVFVVVGGLLVYGSALAIETGRTDTTTSRATPDVTGATDGTSRPPVTPTAAATSPSAVPSPTMPPATPEAPASTTVLLTDLDARNQGLDVEEGSAELAGEPEPYLNSIVYRCELYCDQPQGVVEYNLGAKYTWFDAVAGVDLNAEEGEQVGIFEVYLDGKLIKQYTATLGKPATVHVKVTGGYRLKLVAARPGTTESPLEAGANAAAGVSNALPHLAWGDPRVTSSTTNAG